MKFRARPLTAVLFVVVIVLAVCAAMFLGAPESGPDPLAGLLEGLRLPDGLEIKIGSVGRQMLRRLVLNDVAFCLNGEPALTVDRIRFSASVEELAAHLFKGEAVYDVWLEGSKAALNGEQARILLAFLASAGGDLGQEAAEGQALHDAVRPGSALSGSLSPASPTGRPSLMAPSRALPPSGAPKQSKPLAERTGLRIWLEDGSVEVAGGDLALRAKTADLALHAGPGLSIVSAEVSLGSVEGSFKEKEFSGEDLKLAFDSQGRLSLGAGRAQGGSGGFYGHVAGLRAALDGNEVRIGCDRLKLEADGDAAKSLGLGAGCASADPEAVKPASGLGAGCASADPGAGKPASGLGADVGGLALEAERLAVAATVDFSTGKADGRLDLGKGGLVFAGRKSVQAGMGGLSGGFSGALGGAFAFDFDLETGWGGYGAQTARMEDAALQGRLDTKNRSLEGAVSAKRMEFGGLERIGLEDASVALPQLDFLLEDGYAQGSFSTRISAVEQQSLIGEFSLEVSAEAAIRSKEDFSLKLAIDNLRLQHLSAPLCLDVEASRAPAVPLDAKVKATLGQMLDLDFDFDGQKRSGKAALRLRNFDPGKFGFYLSFLPPSVVQAIGGARLDMDLDLDLRGLEPLEADLGMELGAKGLEFRNAKLDLDVLLDGMVEDGRIEVARLLFSSGGWNLDCHGELEDGLVSSAGLSFEKGPAKLALLRLAQPEPSIWDFEMGIPAVPQLLLKGRLDTAQEGMLVSDSTISYKERVFPAKVSFRSEEMRGDLLAQGVQATAALEDGMIKWRAKADGFKVIPLAGNDLLMMDFELEGHTRPGWKDYLVDLRNFALRRGPTRLLGLDLRAEPGSLEVRNIVAGADPATLFSGEGGLASSDPGVFLDRSSEAFLDLKNLAGESVRLSMTGQRYYISIKNLDLGRLGFGPMLGGRLGLSVLGRIGGTGYGSLDFEKGGGKISCSLAADGEDIVFSGLVSDLAGLDLGNTQILVSRKTKKLSGDIGIAKTLRFRDGDRKHRLDAFLSLDLVPLFSHIGSILNAVWSDPLSVFQLGADWPSLLSGVSGSLEIRSCALGRTIFQPDVLALSLEAGRFSAKGALVDILYDFKSGRAKLDIDRKFGVGIKAEGLLGLRRIDLGIGSVSFPLTLINDLADFSTNPFVEGEATGFARLLGGSGTEAKLFGNLYANRVSVSMFWVPDTIFTIANGTVALAGDRAWSPPQRLLIRRTDTNQISYGTLSTEFDFGTGEWELGLRPEGRSVGLWVPIPSLSLDGRANVGGSVRIGFRDGMSYVEGDIDVSEMEVAFDLGEDDFPAWYLTPAKDARYDLNVRMVSENSLFYPDRRSPFLRLRIRDGERFGFTYRTDTGAFSASGSLALMGGDIYYFQRSFLVTEGRLSFGDRIDLDGGKLNVSLDLQAKLTSYDSDGGKTDIFLILQDSPLDKPEPRFASIPAMDEQQIMRILGRSLLPSSAFGTAGLTSLASVTTAMTRAAGRLRLIPMGAENFGLTSVIRDSLGLDLFSVSSNLVQNILLSVIPGNALGGEISPLARYLDGTSIFAGKHLAPNLFLRAAVGFRADPASARRAQTRFAEGDLRIDLEPSLEWETPLATFTLFARPQELSVFDLFDTIGFSVTKSLRF